MAELKTKQTVASVEDSLNKIADETVRRDARKISELMEKATSEKPKMWGASIVGFGSRHLKYESGREIDYMEIGFSPRKHNLTLYLSGESSLDSELLSKLGKHKLGKGCLYLKGLSDADETVLEKLIENSVENIRRK
jgi:hypothetical protein